MEKKFIFYIALIIIILVLLFLSQQAYSRKTGETLISAATDQVDSYIAKGSEWIKSNIYSKISGEAQSRGEMLKAEISQGKEKISENILSKVGNYFSGISNSIFHPGQNNNSGNNNCETQPVQTPSDK